MGPATLRLREALMEAVAELAGDSGRGRGRAQQVERDQVIVELAAELLDVIDSAATGGDGEPSPGRRAAIAAGGDPDTEPGGEDELSPGQRAAQRARRKRRGTAGDAFDRLASR